ncbi:MAG TPA: IPT/TIG domain-containing protein, partial [Myxococcota bacterium]|nr:IPT/TIG domain-containing protein [Myxococcota bacterium]
SASRVSCTLDLVGLDLASDVFFGVDVADLGGQHALRVLRVRARNGQGVQVVGIRTVPERPSIWTYDVLVGITVAAFDGQPLCGIGSQVVTFTHRTTAAASFSGTGSELWRGPNPVPAKAAGSANVATYWTSIVVNSPAVGDYAVTANVNVLACGGRGATTAVLDADLPFADPPPRWLTPGPVVVSSLPNAGWDGAFPIVDWGPDGIRSSDFNVLQVYSDDGVGMNAFKTGRVRVTTEPYSGRTPTGAVPAAVDFDVVASPEILAVQDGRLVRRGRATDSVTVLPSELGSTFRVFWESQREITAVLGDNGVWLQARDGSAQTVLNPCGGSLVHSAALTATIPRHPAASPNLAVIVADDSVPARHTHCEIDLATGAVVANIALDNAACPDPYMLASDTMTGRLLAAGSGCAFLYRVASPSTIDLGADVTFDGGVPPTSMVLDSRSATALVLVAGTVYTISLTEDVLDAFPWSMQRPVSGVFTATAIAIDPVTGVPWVAGIDSSANATVYLAYTERNSTQVAWIEAQRNDPTAQTPPSMLLFDPGSRALYSSRPKVSFTATASMLTINYADLEHNTTIATIDYPIRAWPDTLDVRDMVMVGPQPIGVSVSSAAPGQRVTVIGSGFNGGGRDEVFLQGVPAQVVASTRESITFVVPPAFRAVADEHHYAYSLQVGVRSSGLLSG